MKKTAAQRAYELDDDRLDELNDAWKELRQWPSFGVYRGDDGDFVVDFFPLLLDVEDRGSQQLLAELLSDAADHTVTSDVSYYTSLASLLRRYAELCDAAVWSHTNFAVQEWNERIFPMSEDELLKERATNVQPS